MKTDTELRQSRQGIFRDEDLLELFQPTALTREWEPNVIVEMGEFSKLATSLESREEIRILDIGGGEGTASAELLVRLFARLKCDVLKVRIDLYETEERRDLYIRHLRERFGKRINVTFYGLFKLDSELQQYDLIIAFHSLYALADGWHQFSDFWDGLSEMKMKLQASLFDDGKVIASLGSLFGVGAVYKRS